MRKSSYDHQNSPFTLVHVCAIYTCYFQLGPSLALLWLQIILVGRCVECELEVNGLLFVCCHDPQLFV